MVTTVSLAQMMERSLLIFGVSLLLTACNGIAAFQVAQVNQKNLESQSIEDERARGASSSLAVSINSQWSSFWSLLPLATPEKFNGGMSSTDPSGNDSNDAGNTHGIYQGGYILFDGKGPGIVNRLWMTYWHDSPARTGRIKMFFDNETTPRVDLTPEELFSGKIAPFIGPLVGNNLKSSGGYFSYVPIPFQTRLIVTSSDPNLFFNVNSHQIPQPKTPIESFTMSGDITALRSGLELVGTNPLKDSVIKVQTAKIIKLERGEKRNLFTFSGPLEISALRMKFPSVNAAVKQTWLHIYWDNEVSPSVSAPLTYLFGAGSGEGPVQSLAFGLTPQGAGYLYFPMPFRRSARIEIENRSALALQNGIFTVSLRSFVNDFEAEDDILPFHATYNSSHTEAGKDTVFLDAVGRGKVVGVVYDFGFISQILEGDEKIFIDGATTPTYQGTGTEDFFNAGWYWNHCLLMPNCYNGAEPLTLPLHGMVQNRSAYRLFILDPIIFRNQIQFRLQHGQLNNDLIPPRDWMINTSGLATSSVAFWYGVAETSTPPPNSANRVGAIISLHSDKCMQIRGESLVNGKGVEQRSCAAKLAVAQRWELRYYGDGLYQIVSSRSGKCLDVHKNATDDGNRNGAWVQQYECMGLYQKNQLWRLNPIEGGYQIISVNSGKCLDLDIARSPTDGTQIQQWECYGPQQRNQIWKIQ